MSGSNLTLPTETEDEARERLAKKYERDADAFAAQPNLNQEFQAIVVDELRARAASLRAKAPVKP